MARFKDIAKGYEARRFKEFTLMDGSSAGCDVLALNGKKDADILRGAREFAAARGVPDAKAGDPLYELGTWVHTLLHACADAEVADRFVAYFESVEEILEHLDRDRISLLFETQQAWQDICAQRPGTIPTQDFITNIAIHAAAPEDAEELPFERWRPATRRAFVRSMASLCIAHANRSPSTLATPASSQNSAGSSTNTTSSDASSG